MTTKNHQKRRQTLIEKHGSEEAYLEWQRETARKGGKTEHPRTFDNREKAREAAKKRWQKKYT